jgi:hypothetical protein
MDGISGPSEPKLQLKLGDIIDYGGIILTVTKNDPTAWHDFPIEATSEKGQKMIFTEDGRSFHQQTYPIIKVIGESKPKVKYWKWVYEIGGDWKVTHDLYDENHTNVNGKKYIQLSASSAQKIELTMVEL